MSTYSKFLELISGSARTVDLSTNTLSLGAAQLNGATSGTFTQSANATTTSYSVFWPSAQGSANTYLKNDGSGNLSWASAGTGSVTSVSVTTANGFAGTVATATTTPAITISTTITGILQGNGTAISAATTGNFTDSTSGADGITVTNGTGAVLGSGTSIAQTQSSASLPGYLSAADWTTFNNKQPAGSYITALTGDATASGPGSAALTLATVNSNVGSFGGASSVPSFTVNAKGLITAASATAVVAPAGTLSGTTLNSTVTASSLTSLGAQSQALNMNSHQINNLATPTSSTDAATKAYVDAAINGLTWKGPVQAYSTSNVPLSGGATLTIDGYSVQNGDYVILSNQTTASQNNVYVASGIGTAYSLALAPSSELTTAIGDAYLIEKGTVWSNSAVQANAISPNNTYIQFAGPNFLTFNAPLSLTGTTVSITQATTSTNGYLSSTDWNTFNNKQPAGSYITALTGDVTASGPGSAAASLVATSNATLTTLSALTTATSLSSVGTITSGTWNGTAIAPTHGGTGITSYTTGDILYASASNVLSKLPIGTTNQVLTVSSGNVAWANQTASPVAPPNIVTLSGSGNYTPTAGTIFIIVEMVGGGGGGGAGGNVTSGQTSGGNTTFGSSLLTANGGAAGAAGSANGGAGGTTSVGGGATTIKAFTGGDGSGAGSSLPAPGSYEGAPGGSNPFGGAGAGGEGTNGVAAGSGKALTGAGGGGGGVIGTAAVGSGGGAGGYIQALINSPSGPYAYSVGAGGTAGTNGGDSAGGAGGSGTIIISEYFSATGNAGSVTTVSVVSANGFAGTVATATTTPAITISTTITGLLKGNGTAISAAVAGTDYVTPSGSITGSAGSISRILIAGQSFSANTSYAVRWGLTANGETAGRVYAADITTSSFDLFYVIGMASSGSSVSAGQNITVTSWGSFTLSSSDTAFGSGTDGDAVFLTANGTFSTTAPSTAGQAVTRIGVIQVRSATNTSNIIDVSPQVIGVN